MDWILSGLFGLGAGFVTAILKSRVEVGAQVDRQLRQERAAAYKGLWAHTGVLPQWPRRHDVTFADLQELCERLRDWYFNVGGVYLSSSSFDKYADVQKALSALAIPDQAELLTADTYDSIRRKCSALRSSLADDLQSRKAQALWPV